MRVLTANAAMAKARPDKLTMEKIKTKLLALESLRLWARIHRINSEKIT